MKPLTGADIRDPDLLAELAKHPTGFGRETMMRVLADTQAKRDTERRRRDALTAIQRRRDNVAKSLSSSPATPDDLRHIHSVLAICGLPYARQADGVRRFERKQGRMSLVVHAGELKGPDGKTIAQPLPYGSRARLLMLHLCSEAIRQKSPTIQIEDSLTAFIRGMGFPVTGGPRGTLTAFKTQLNALAACHLQIGMWDGQRSRTINAVPFSEIDVWMPTDPDQRMLWPSQITFSLDFYKSLTTHALPVNVQAVRAFANSPRKLDILFWLGLRLNGLRKPTAISWEALKDQFGDGFGRERAFREKFQADIAQFREVFPKLPVILNADGLHIEPAETTLLALPKRRKA
jgi:hypothetical protein